MHSLLALTLTLTLAQTPSPAPAAPPTAAPAAAASEDAATRAAQAAEKAAAAAQSAAESAARAATAAEQVASRSAPAAAVAPTPAAAPKSAEAAAWTGSLGAGFISLTGNARTLTFNANAVAERKTEAWIFGAKAASVYGYSRPPESDAAPQTVALNALLQVRADRRLTDLVSLYLLGGADTDHVKSIEARTYGELGVGLMWLDSKQGDLQKVLLRTDFAFRAGREQRFQYYPAPLDLEDITLLAPRFGVAFRYALSKDVTFHEDFEVLYNVPSGPRVLANSTTKISARLLSSLSLGVGFQVNHDSAPPAPKLPTDTALSVGLEVGL